MEEVLSYFLKRQDHLYVQGIWGGLVEDNISRELPPVGQYADKRHQIFLLSFFFEY